MPEIDTAAEREELRRRSYQFAGQYAHGRFLTVLAEYDLLRGRQAVAAENIDRLRAENRRLREDLAAEAITYRDMWDEAESVLRQLDGLAEQWGDEAVFRRCRDRLRALTEAGE